MSKVHRYMIWDKVNDYSWQEEKQKKEVEGLNEVIEAQAIILKAFAEFIVGLDGKEPISPKGKKG